MDYISIASSIGAKHVKIPFFATKKRNAGTPFHDFLNQHGVELFVDPDSTDKERHIADVVQSWLFFALIGEVTGESLDPADFKQGSESEGIFVDLDRLASAIARRDSLTSSASEAIGTAKTSLYALEKLLSNTEYHSLDLVVLSVWILLSWLVREEPRAFFGEGDLGRPSARALKRLMIENGWCVYHWGQVRCYYDIETLYYLATIPRQTEVGSKHEQCTESICRGWSVTMDMQVTHTTRGCRCEVTGVSTLELCKIIENGDVPVVSTRREKDGSISLTLSTWDGWTPYTAMSHVWADGLGNPTSNALPQCQLKQLHRLLQRLPSDTRCHNSDFLEIYLAQSRHPLWLDTLCIPVGALAGEADLEGQSVERMLAAKRKAIDGMGFIYASASPVLVLDAELLSLPSETDDNDLVSLITYSGWMTRAWTLQEGSLPRKLIFAWSTSKLYDMDSGSPPGAPRRRLKLPTDPSELLAVRFMIARPRHPAGDLYLGSRNRARSLLSDAGMSEVSRRRKEMLLRFWHSHVSRFSENQGKMRAEEMEADAWVVNLTSEEEKRLVQQVRTLQAAWTSLSKRHTSQPRDVPIILANLLRLQTSSLHHMSNPVAAILGSLMALPLSIFFLAGSRHTSSTDMTDLGSISDEATHSDPPPPPLSPPPSSSPATATLSEPVQLRPLKTVIEGAKNRWVPKAIEGELPPSDLYVEMQEYHLVLRPGLPATSGSRMLFLEGQSRVLSDFFLLSYASECPKLKVHAFQSSDGLGYAREIEKITSGLFFLFQAPPETFSVGKGQIKGAIFAAIGPDRRNPQTIFCCSCEATLLPRSSSSGDLLTFNATPGRPGAFHILYDKEALGNIYEEHFSTQPQHTPSGVGNVSILCGIPALNSLAFTTIIFIRPQRSNVSPLATFFAIYWLLLLFYSGLRVLMRSWFLRFRVSMRFKSGELSTFDRRTKVATYIFMHYLLFSTITFIYIHHILHWALVIVMVAVGGTVGMLFAFAQSLVLIGILIVDYLSVW